ncbi:MAG: site-specific integrase [Alphaproteobacteria bacterium]|nr:site-specific integrase [Alphaproteobacteria bacterium]
MWGAAKDRRSAETQSKQQAQEFHDKLKADSWRVSKLGEKPQYTWDQAALRWLQETSHKKSHEEDKRHVRWLKPYLSSKTLISITREVVTKIAEEKRQNASPATVNRVLALIRAILRRAMVEWEWIERVPVIRLYKEPKRRVRWLTPEQAARLLEELPEHLAEMMRFSLATGLRQSNVAKLEWPQVDMARKCAWIYGDQAKGGKDIPVTLNTTALAVLERQKGRHESRVFSYKGRPIGQVGTKAWRGALERAGIKNFRWHDLRHTWASWLAQSGVSLNVLQEMGAWESAEMVRRYAHLAPAQFHASAQVIDSLLVEPNGTIAAQSEVKEVVSQA